MQGKEFGWTTSDPEIKPQKVQNFLCYANYVFDAHVWEIYQCIVNGHVLYILDNSTRQDIKLLKTFIDKNKINIGLLPPVILDEDELLNLDILIVGGSQINSSILKKYLKHGKYLVNAYGPTEITVYSTVQRYTNTVNPSNIGTPIPNTKACLLYTSPSPRDS